MISMGEEKLSHIEVIGATANQKPILENLLELYSYDFSEFQDLELGADGRFGYKNLALYWGDPNRYPFLVRVDGRWAGFALVKRGSELSDDGNVWDMAEFFVVRKYRKMGLGTKTAHEVWRCFPGIWEIRVMESNPAAHQFWERAVGAFVGVAVPSALVEKDAKRWCVFSFESKSACDALKEA